MKLKNIIILAGGLGKRLGSITKKTPKPLISFNKIPFLDYQIFFLRKLKPKKIIILCRYKNKKFIQKYNNKKIFNITLKCIVEKTPLGTGGALENSKSYIVNNTMVCNGDTFFDYNFSKIKDKNLGKNCCMLLLVKNKNYKSNRKLSNLSLSGDKIKYVKKSKYMNSGFYIMNKGIIKFLKQGRNSLEEDIIPEIIKEKKIIGKFCKNYKHIDIGTKKNLKYFKKFSKLKLFTKDIQLI